MTAREILDQIQNLLDSITKEQREMVLILLTDHYCLNCGDIKTECSCKRSQ